jgi:uncharacterized cupredoxin-like copper-binding protein
MVAAIVVWDRYLRPAVVMVELDDGRVSVRPDTVRAGSRPIKFEAENIGSEPHQFLVISIHKPPGQIPVKNGEAQFFTDPGQETMIYYDGQNNGGYSIASPNENPPLGPPLQPGEQREVQMGYPVEGFGAQTLTILCNLPGHYERGEYTIVEVEE